MVIENIETVFYIFQFILPGYLIVTIISSIMPRKKYSEGELLVQTIGYSVVNMAIWAWLFIGIGKYIQCKAECYWFIRSTAVILTGIITGFIFGIIRRTEVVRKIFAKFGITLEHPVPRAWDYKFSNDTAYWVEVTVSSGKVIRGLYSSKSFSSSDPDCRDIYLEQLFAKDEAGVWTKVERTAGVWINPDEIRFIKFYDMEEDDGK